jgi:enoyl-[acyl-carrier-protein] reductase (NADH)
LEGASVFEQVYQEYEREMALRRVTTANALANAVCFLASDDSKNMTGQSMTVDGGWDVEPHGLA